MMLLELMNRAVASEEPENFVARRPGIFLMITKSQRRQLRSTYSKKRNTA
jgi:hypothetical protein